MRRADRMRELGTETSFEVLAEVKRLEQAGRSIINFAIGEPDFNTPEHVKEAAIEALRQNHTHYSPSAGIISLREAIAVSAGALRGIPFKPSEVVVTPGAKPILLYTLLACVETGDEVIYPNPGYPIYESVIRLTGASPVPIPLREQNRFQLDIDELAALITPRTRAIVLNSPHNPTGSALSLDQLKDIAELACRHDLMVLSDEVYSRIIFRGEFNSIASLDGMKERTVVVDGFSKTFAMTGWRLGFGLMPEAVATEVARLVTNVESCVATFVQMAGITALTGPQAEVERMVATFRRRTDRMVRGLRAIPGIECLAPDGAFYVFPNISGACLRLNLRSSLEFQQRLLHEVGVATLSRSAFGLPNPGEDGDYIRLSCAAAEGDIEEGLRRMAEWIWSRGEMPHR